MFRLGRRLEEAERRALGVGVEGLVDPGCRSAAVRQDQLWSEPDSAFALEERHALSTANVVRSACTKWSWNR